MAAFLFSICSLTLMQHIFAIHIQEPHMEVCNAANKTWTAHPLESEITARLDLSEISAKVAKENGWSFDFVSRVSTEYAKFLYIIKHFGSPAVPCKKVDLLWHQHILDTRVYQQDMGRIFGKFIHHVPSYTIDERRATGDKFKVFQDRYTSTFGSMPLDIWGNKAATDCTENCKGDECNDECKIDDECSCIREEFEQNVCTDISCEPEYCSSDQCECVLGNNVCGNCYDCSSDQCSGHDCVPYCTHDPSDT